MFTLLNLFPVVGSWRQLFLVYERISMQEQQGVRLTMLDKEGTLHPQPPLLYPTTTAIVGARWIPSTFKSFRASQAIRGIQGNNIYILSCTLDL